MVLARDRFGVKPLYYHREAAAGLYFASEIKALFVDPAVPRALNEQRLAEYLTYRQRCRRGDAVRRHPRGRAGHAAWSSRATACRPAALLDARSPGRDGLMPPATSKPAAALLYDAVAAPPGQRRPARDDHQRRPRFEPGERDRRGRRRPLDRHVLRRLRRPAYDERPFARAVAGRIGARHHEIEVTSDRDRSRAGSPDVGARRAARRIPTRFRCT